MCGTNTASCSARSRNGTSTASDGRVACALLDPCPILRTLQAAPQTALAHAQHESLLEMIAKHANQPRNLQLPHMCRSYVAAIRFLDADLTPECCSCA